MRNTASSLSQRAGRYHQIGVGSEQFVSPSFPSWLGGRPWAFFVAGPPKVLPAPGVSLPGPEANHAGAFDAKQYSHQFRNAETVFFPKAI